MFTSRSVYGIGTDITVTQTPTAPEEGGGAQGPRFEFGADAGATTDGTTTLSQSRLIAGFGTPTFDASTLDTVLGIQNEINEAARAQGRPEVSLINTEELARIEELIAADTWPNRWTGDEVTGDVLLPIMPTKGGGQQFTIASVLEAP